MSPCLSVPPVIAYTRPPTSSWRSAWRSSQDRYSGKVKVVTACSLTSRAYASAPAPPPKPTTDPVERAGRYEQGAELSEHAKDLLAQKG